MSRRYPRAAGGVDADREPFGPGVRRLSAAEDRREPSPAVRQNLKRITAIAWLGGANSQLNALDAAAQYAAVRLVMASGVPVPTPLR